MIAQPKCSCYFHRFA